MPEPAIEDRVPNYWIPVEGLGVSSACASLHRRGVRVYQEEPYSQLGCGGLIMLLSLLILTLPHATPDVIVFKILGICVVGGAGLVMCLAFVGKEKKLVVDMGSRSIELGGGRAVGLDAVIGLQACFKTFNPPLNVNTENGPVITSAYQLNLAFLNEKGCIERRCLLADQSFDAIMKLANSYGRLCGFKFLGQDKAAVESES